MSDLKEGNASTQDLGTLLFAFAVSGWIFRQAILKLDLETHVVAVKNVLTLQVEILALDAKVFKIFRRIGDAVTLPVQVVPFVFFRAAGPDTEFLLRLIPNLLSD